MTRSELTVKLADTLSHLMEKDVKLIVDNFIETMSSSLATGERIEIRGFGSFSLHYHAPRPAHNPKNGMKLITEPKYKPHFKPGKDLRERVNASRTTVALVPDTDDDEE